VEVGVSAPGEKKKLGGLGAEQLSALVGIVAAVAVAAIANVLVARHFTRWDWTSARRYTLSAATKTTLHELTDTVDVWVLMGSADPLEQSVKQLLVSYAAETTKLEVHYVDPDRDALALEDVRKKFNIQAGVTQDGHVATDAIVVVARGPRHWFLGASDMIEVSSPDDPRARPREEQSITGAIRNVSRDGERPRVCFTAGHGELALDEAGAHGLAFLKDLLIKDNYEPVTVDTTEPNAHEPFKGCAVAVIAGPRGEFSKEEEARLKTYLLEGGSLLAAISPINAASESGMVSAGVAGALAPFGIALDDDLVFEREPQAVIPQSHDIRFFVEPKPHPVTAALVRSAENRDPPRVSVHFTRSLKHVAPPGAAPAVDLAVTSDKAFGVTSISGAADWNEAPEKGTKDLAGPLAVAMASERPKTSPRAPHGPRAVVIGTGSAMIEQNWREPTPVRGMAFLVENAISWLASKPEILDVPQRPTVAAGVRIDEGARAEVRRYVLIFMPLAAALLGIAVALRRRATEGAPRVRARSADEREKSEMEREKKDAKTEPEARGKGSKKNET
jgi:hypothetical protein